MGNKVYIIHGWAGYPEECWFMWLKGELEKQGIEVEIPLIPDADSPDISKWVSYLDNIVKEPDEETYFVGHSIGVQAILRYLEKVIFKVGGILSVAGFYTLTENAFEDEEDKETARPWLETPIDNKKVRNNAAKITAIFSDNDPYVPLENRELFKDRLGANIVTVEGKGHMGGGDNIKEFPLVLKELLELMK